jgi:hypothetical protein
VHKTLVVNLIDESVSGDRAAIARQVHCRAQDGEAAKQLALSAVVPASGGAVLGAKGVDASTLQFHARSIECDQEGFMAESDARKLLVPLTLRTDVPQDARDAIAAAIQGTPLSTDVWIYRAVVVILGLTVLSTVFGGLALVAVGHADPSMKLPASIVAIGSAAVGALAGLLAPSPVTRT